MISLISFHNRQNTELFIRFLSLPCCLGLPPVCIDVPFTPFSDTKGESLMFTRHQIQFLSCSRCHGQTREAFTEIHSTLWSTTRKISYYGQRVLFTVGGGGGNRSSPARNAVTVGCGRKAVIVVCAKHKSKQDHK